MLVQYSVENYKSIKNEIILNFRVDKKYEGDRWAIREEGVPPLYKCLGLIGPNASGKTNIMRSFLFALKFIVNTIERKESAKIKIERFRLDESCMEEPASFEFIFYQNKIKYVYGFSVNEDEVVEEYLLGYFSAKPKTLFERLEGQHYEFRGNDVKIQKQIVEKTNSNRLYMPVAAEWGYEPLKTVYDWFRFVSRQYEKFDISSMVEQIVQKKERKELLLSELQKADFNIVDIYVKKRRMNDRTHDLLQKIFSEFAGEMREVDIPDVRADVRLVHENRKGERLDIELDEDSAGTSVIVQNIVELLSLSEKGGLMLEDELGKVYHTRLTQHFLEILKSDTVNCGNAQLLFTSHDTKILNLLNPDQIYLVDKEEDGATCVKLLDDFAIRENENIELGYLKGRYGSVPYMKG